MDVQGPGNWINGTCPHDCPDACGIRTRVEQGRAVAFEAQPEHPVADGWLCAKVNPYLERVYHADRLTTPLRRTGRRGSGQWQAVSWKEAIGEIAERWQGLIASHGPESILPYSYSGTLGLVQMTVAGSRFWNRLGASRLERTICMAGSRHAVRATLGKRMSPPYHHVLDSRLLIFWGHNPVSTAPHLMPFVRRARRQGCRVVVIDPVRSRSARGSDLHLRPRPGTDGLLALGIAKILAEDNLVDEDWLAGHAHGWPAFRRRIASLDLASVISETGISGKQLRRLAHWLGSSHPAMIRLGDAINRHTNAGQTVRAIACLPALVGQYGVRGGGLGSSTGDWFTWDDEAINRWAECPPPGRIVNMNRLGAALCGEVRDPPIRSLFVFGANPMVSAPNSALVEKGLLREDLFTVVHDLFMTDTAALADLVLPATSQLEQEDLHRGYGHTLLGYNHPAIPPAGESRSNWETMQLLSRAMGFGESWLYESPAEVVDGILRATAATEPPLRGITLRKLRQNGFVAYADGDEVPFAGGEFATPSGRVELDSSAYSDCGLNGVPDGSTATPREDTPPGCNPADGLHLLSPAAHHFVNSSMANQAALVRREREASVMLHPEDAAARSLEAGGRVKVFNTRGHCYRIVTVSEDTLPGVAVATNGFWQGEDGMQSINRTTSDRLADVAGQSTFHSNRVWVVRDGMETGEESVT